MRVPIVISPRDAGRTVGELMQARWSLTQPQAWQLIKQERIFLSGKPCTDPKRRVRRGQRLELRRRGSSDHGKPGGATTARGKPANPGTSPSLLKSIRIRYVDDDVVVVEKPAGLTTMRHPEEAAEFGRRAKRFLPATLVDLLPPILEQRQRGRSGTIRAVHRLDKETSGLVVFARNPHAESELGKQFRAHTVDRTYLALVRGRAVAGRIESSLVRDRGDGRRGSSRAPNEGQRAITHVRVLEDLGDFTLVECRLETGRTHQVRIHLGEQGTPLCGERIYDRPVHGKPLSDTSGAPRIALHAATLGLTHPRSQKPMHWQSPLPADLQELLTRLRRRKHSQE